MQDSKRLELMGKGLAWENVTKAKTNSAGHALLEIAPRIAAMEDESERLRRFAQKMLEGWPEDFGDVDGLTIQDAAVECGLLVGETRHESCGEDCNCASYSTGSSASESISTLPASALPPRRHKSGCSHEDG